MIVNNDNLLSKIEEWNKEVSKNDKIIDMALFKIFIEFEKFLENSFVSYALGISGKNNFFPTLRLQFKDKKHLEGLLRCDSQYIDYIKKIPKIKEFIFEEKDCPFHKVFVDPKFRTHFEQIQVLRNFIAHESEESKEKYKRKVLRASGINKYISVDTFLKTINKKRNISYYAIYIETMKFYSDVICDASSK